MNARQHVSHSWSKPYRVTIPLRAAHGGLRVLLRGALLPSNVKVIRFVRYGDSEGKPAIRVLADGSGPIELPLRLRRALGHCFLRFLSRVQTERRIKAPREGDWEWSVGVGVLIHHRHRGREHSRLEGQSAAWERKAALGNEAR
jgi:hypothetical protein